MRVFIWILAFSISVNLQPRSQIHAQNGYFRLVKRNLIEADSGTSLIQPAFFSCAREKSCQNVVRRKNREYLTVAGNTELREVDEIGCIWKKHSELNQYVSTNLACDVKEVGLESNILRDDKMTASSSNSNYQAWKGRLNGKLAWIPLTSDTNPYIQVDFGKNILVHAVATQGFEAFSSWVTSFLFSHSNDGINFIYLMQESVNIPLVITGNTNGFEVLRIELKSPILTRYFRIYPKDKENRIALKIEFYGCYV